MAPEKNPKKRARLAEKEFTLWPKCKKVESLNPAFISLHSVGRNFGISFQVRLFLSNKLFYILSFKGPN